MLARDGVPISGTKRRQPFAFSTNSIHNPNCNRICQEEARRLRTLYIMHSDWAY